MYGSVSAAYRALPSGENDEDVCDGTVWRAVARTDVLEAPDMRHADTDGVFLGSASAAKRQRQTKQRTQQYQNPTS